MLLLNRSVEVVAAVNVEPPITILNLAGWSMMFPRSGTAFSVPLRARCSSSAPKGLSTILSRLESQTNERPRFSGTAARENPFIELLSGKIGGLRRRCTALKDAGHESLFRDRTGLVLDPYFSGTKAAWLLDNVPGVPVHVRSEESCSLAPLTAGWRGKLTGAHVTDPSNALEHLLFNLHTMDWDDELLQILGVPRACLPRIVDNAEVVGHTTGIPFVADGTPVAGLAGDQQSALFGQACFAVGEAKCTYGTGAFLLMNTGATPVPSSNGLLTTVAWRLNGQTTYALEGSAFIAGAAVQWLRDGLQIISSAAEVEALAETVEDTNGITFVPAFAGLGAPHWRPEARGVCVESPEALPRLILHALCLRVWRCRMWTFSPQWKKILAPSSPSSRLMVAWLATT